MSARLATLLSQGVLLGQGVANLADNEIYPYFATTSHLAKQLPPRLAGRTLARHHPEGCLGNQLRHALHNGWL